MSWAAAMLASLVSTLERPAWWVLGLASFLIRGGLLVFILPIVILPTPAGLQTAFGTEIVGFAFGSPSGAFVASMVIATTAITAWLLIGGMIAAWTDIALVAAVAGSRRLGPGVTGWLALAGRALVIRLMSHVPLALALLWGVARVYDAAFAEYLRPGDLSVPYFVRIALRIPDVIAVIAVAWMVGETAGGLAIRHLALGRLTMARALARGWRDLVVRPTTALTLVVAAAALLAVTVAVAAGAGRAWDRLRAMLADGADPNQLLAAVLVFAATWFAGVAAVGVVAAWRSAAWTFEVARRGPIGPRHESPGEAV